jgi:small-conductance mechanosensitive channel
MTILGLTLASDVLVKLAVVAAILIVTLVLTRVAGRLVRRSMAATESLPAASIIVNITRGAVLVIGVLTVLAVLGISITPVLTALGVGGLAVALALQDTLGNLFAGLQLIASRQVRPGDYLLLDSGQEGVVADIAWRTTTLRTLAENLVIIPNAKLAQAVVTNFRLPAAPLAVYVNFGVMYDSDLERVEAIALEVAREVMREMQPDLTGHDPLIRFPDFGPSEVTGRAVLHASEHVEQYALRSEFVKRLHARFAAEGIQFAFPTRTVHLAKE